MTTVTRASDSTDADDTRPHAAACAALRRAKQDLAEILSAFELLDRASLDLVTAQLKGGEEDAASVYGYTGTL